MLGLIISAPVLTTGALADVCADYFPITISGGTGLTSYPINISFNRTANTPYNASYLRLATDANATVPFLAVQPATGNMTIYFNYTDGTTYMLYNCSAIATTSWLNLSSFGNRPSTTWDYGSDGVSVGGSGGGWTTSYCAATFTPAHFHSGSPFGNNVSATLSAADCDFYYLFSGNEMVAGKYGFWLKTATSDATVSFQLRVSDPSYSRHHQLWIVNDAAVIYYNGGTSTSPSKLTPNTWYSFEVTYNTSAGNQAWTVTNDTWRWETGLLSEYQVTENYIARLFFYQGGYGGNTVIDDIWVRNYNTTLNITAGVGGIPTTTTTTTTTTLPPTAGAKLYGIRCAFITKKPLLHIEVR